MSNHRPPTDPDPTVADATDSKPTDPNPNPNPTVPGDLGSAEHPAVDELGRAAGAALRRPAPADGVRRLRSARRRQQATRVVAAGATAAVLALGVVAATRPDDEFATIDTPATTVTTAPPGDPTVRPATTVPGDRGSITTLVPGATAPTSQPANDTATVPAFETWMSEQREAGRILVSRFAGRGTDAAVVVADNLDPATGELLPAGATERTYDSVVALADGRVAPLPGGTVVGGLPGLQLVGLGDRLAAIPTPSGTPTVDAPVLLLLDDATLTWSAGPDLGWGPAPGLFVEAWSVGGSVLIGRSAWIEDDAGAVPAAGTDGVIVRPDLTVEPVAPVPDGLQASWTSVAGDLAFSFGWAGTGSAFTYPPAPNPWALDVAANEWITVPNPDWMDCGDCEWAQPTEGPATFLEVGTDRGALVRVPDGTIGLFDTSTRTWRQMQQFPYTLSAPVTATVGDLVVVAPVEQTEAERGIVGVLDLVSGTWSTTRLVSSSPAFGWDVRTDGSEVLVQPAGPIEQAGAIEVGIAEAVDATGTWRNVTSDEAAAWLRFAASADLRVHPWF